MACVCDHNINDHEAEGEMACMRSNCDCQAYLDTRQTKPCKACVGRGHDWKGDDCMTCKGNGYLKIRARATTK